MCPYCRNVVVVPADAQKVVAGQTEAGQAPGQGAAEEEQPVPESSSDNVVAFLATYLPSWGTSVVIHLAAILIALTATTAAKQPQKVEFQADIVIRDNTTHRLTQDKHPETRIEGQKARTTRGAMNDKVSSFVFQQNNNAMADVANNNQETVEVIGVGGGGMSMGGMAGFGTGRGGGGGGDVAFFSVGSVAKKVVFVVDHSGSMTDSIMYVKFELKRSIRSLKPNQQFYVVFYSSGPALKMPSLKLVPATEANKQQAYEFIDSIVPIGQTDPSEALKNGFEVGPEAMYILTDGEFDPQIAGLVARLNAKKEVTVNTICFVYSSGEALLQKIAQQNNGVYKFVGEDDLQSLGEK
jgi:hypothetical protein